MKSFCCWFILGALLLLSLAGCESTSKAFSARPLSRSPQVRALVLDQPYKAPNRGSLGPQQITLPAGRYFPRMEDAAGIYYFTPSTIWVRDLTQIPFPNRGGIYLEEHRRVALPFLMSTNGLVPWIQDSQRPLTLSRIRLE